MKSAYPTALLGIIAALLVGYNSLSANWLSPTAIPPGNNVPAPINVGTSTQQKDGVLGVDGLGVFGSAYIQGASTSDIYDNAVTLEVEGKIGADLYCDEMGIHCVRIEDLLNNPPATSTGFYRETFSPPRKNNLLVATFGGNGWTTWTQWCQENGFDRAENATMGPTANPCAGNVNRAGAFTNWRYDWNCNYATVRDLTCVREQ